MKWTTQVSDAPETLRAASEAIERVRSEVPSPDLLVVFASPQHDCDWLAQTLAREFPNAVTLGCSAHSVIGAGRELEGTPGLALVAAELPGVELHPFRLDPATLPDTRLGPDLFGVSPGTTADFVVLADPFTAQTERLLGCLDAGFPQSVVVGGLASGGTQPGENALIHGGRALPFGLVGVALVGNVTVEAIVAQGCRPVGEPMFVTRCRDGLLLTLDGKPPVEQLETLYDELTPEDQLLCRDSLFVGLVMREDEVEYQQGDFLIRNLVGMDEESGAIQVAADLREAQVVQFHLRDATTSTDDLRACLERYRQGAGAHSAAGALLFSCLGRGIGLYGEPDHDSRLFSEQLGPIPLGGFFCNGEIGPVRRRTYLHGYTSSFAIFRPKS